MKWVLGADQATKADKITFSKWDKLTLYTIAHTYVCIHGTVQHIFIDLNKTYMCI